MAVDQFLNEVCLLCFRKRLIQTKTRRVRKLVGRAISHRFSSSLPIYLPACNIGARGGDEEWRIHLPIGPATKPYF